MTSEPDRSVACFAQLRAVTPSAVHTYDLGADSVRVRYLNTHLAGLLHPAIAHLENRQIDRAPNLTIHAFVSSRPPLKLTGDEWMESSKRLKTTPFAPENLFTHLIPGDDGRLDVLHGARHEGFTCFRDVRRVPAWDVATPFRDLLQSWNRLRDGHLVHGGVVANGNHAILLAGVGGSGKSSSTLECLLHSDLYFMGDDLCLIRRTPGGIYVYSLYNSAKLLPHDFERFGTGFAHYDDSLRGDGKPTLYTYPTLVHRLATVRPICAILLLRQYDSEHTQLQLADGGEAWKAIGPSTLSLVPSDAGSFRWLAELVSSLPVWQLRLGRRRDEIPSAIKRALTLCTPGNAEAAYRMKRA